MKVLLSWINDFVDISSLTVADIVNKFNRIGFEVEEVIDNGKAMENVVVAKIIKIKKHPNADKLVICQADCGKAETIQIVTGATNMKEGDRVALALDGANLPCGKTIKAGEIRGEKSNGMFCGGDELGLNDKMYEGAEVNGLLILTKNEKIGQPIAKALELDEIVLDLSVLPNRPDCNSIMGIAREIAAAFDLAFKMPDLVYKTIDAKKSIAVNVENKTNCPRYMGTVIENIKNGPSPQWMQKRLMLCGHAPYNLMVDITNYVLTEIGQPMHAFDYSKIEGSKLIIRDAKEGETIVALDGNEYKLNNKNLVIADAKKPLVIAGIMGGEQSGTYETTVDVFLESAIFDYANIRRSKNALGLSSASCIRFSKGVYFDSAEIGLKRALNLIDRLGVGKISSIIVDEKGIKPKTVTIKSNVNTINERLAIDLSATAQVKMLNKLDIKTTASGSTLISAVPSFRTDMEQENDIIEEIGRSYGYENLDDGNVSKTAFRPCGMLPGEQKNINLLKLAAASEGFSEMVSFQFYSPKWITNINDNPDSCIKIVNPVSFEYSIMRKSLLPAMLSALSYNQKQGNKNLYLFEFAHVFLPKQLPLTELPYEPNFLTLAINADSEDFYSLKHSLNKILASVNATVEYRQGSSNFLHPGICADVYLYNRKIGVIGEIHPSVAQNFEVLKKTYVAEIDLSQIIARDLNKKEGKAPDKFPNIERDIALIVKKDRPVGELLANIKKFARDEVATAFVFDVYEGNQVEAGYKSVAIKLFIKQNEKTLTEQEISTIVKKVLTAQEKDGAKLRV